MMRRSGLRAQVCERRGCVLHLEAEDARGVANPPWTTGTCMTKKSVCARVLLPSLQRSLWTGCPSPLPCAMMLLIVWS